MSATASSASAILMAMGGYHSWFRLADALGVAGGMSFNTVTGGVTAVASNVYLVLDGSTVTLPTPSSGAMIVVMSATPNGATVAPAGTNTINGVNANIEVGQNALVLHGTSTTAWVTQ
jgi:hypothetical protein